MTIEPNNKANQYSPVVTAVAMSTKTWKKKYLPTHCLIPAVKVKVTSVQDAIRKEDAKEMFEYL